MFGIIIFLLCVGGLWHVLRRPRSAVPVWWTHAGDLDGVRPHCRHGFARHWLGHTLTEVDPTPTQERAIFDAVDRATDELRESAASLLSARKRVAAVFCHDALSSDEVNAALDDESGGLQRAREAIGQALATIHAALDDRQRRVLARRLAQPHVIF
jgi:uncharacterized membrane protein